MNREKLHRAIRTGDFTTVKQLIESPEGQDLAKAKNYYGRTAVHIAVLHERDEIVQYLATLIKQTLHIGDNVSPSRVDFYCKQFKLLK